MVPVGVLDFEVRPDKQISVFRYSDEWLDNPVSFSIAPSLPLATRVFHESAPYSDPRPSLPSVFADCAPDGWGRRLVAQDMGKTPTELEYLLAANDRTRHGALRFLDEHGRPLAYGVPPVPRLSQLPDIRRLAGAFETGKGDLRAVAHELRGWGSTLGGARPKSDYEDADGVLHIAKYTTEKDTLPIERMEVATLRLAQEAGLRAATGKLALDRTSYPVALIKRFDRAPDGGRLHYVSARTFLGTDSGHYTDLADQMRSSCRGEELAGELRELHRRILFSILVSNDDDHLKNHGFLYAGDGNWRLSPAFDINPNPNGSTQLQTGIGEQFGHQPSIGAAVEAAPLFEVNKDAAMADVRRMAKVVSERWRPLCTEAGMDRHACDRYADAFNRADGYGQTEGRKGQHRTPKKADLPDH